MQQNICQECVDLHKERTKLHGICCICCICSYNYALKSDNTFLQSMHLYFEKNKKSFKEILTSVLTEFVFKNHLWYTYDIEVKIVNMPLDKKFEIQLELEKEKEKRNMFSFNDGKNACFIFRKIKECDENYGIGFCRECCHNRFGDLSKTPYYYLGKKRGKLRELDFSPKKM